jgi:hypothetical protein
MRIVLDYFMESGQWECRAEADLELSKIEMDGVSFTPMFSIWAEVIRLREERALPGLPLGHKDYAVLVDAPDHPHRCLRFLPFPGEVRSFATRDATRSFASRVSEALEILMPGTVSARVAPDMYVIDEPVRRLVRVRFGDHVNGKLRIEALARAGDALDRIFISVIAEHWTDEAELLVFE